MASDYDMWRTDERRLSQRIRREPRVPSDEEESGINDELTWNDLRRAREIEKQMLEELAKEQQNEDDES